MGEQQDNESLHREGSYQQGRVEPVPDNRSLCSPEARQMIHAQSNAAMHKKHANREHIALGVFVILVILSVTALCIYIGAGHNLNVAATNIDDMTGDMSGYGVILFQGTVDPDAAEDEDDDDNIITNVLDAVGLSDEDDSDDMTLGTSGTSASSSSSSETSASKNQSSAGSNSSSDNESDVNTSSDSSESTDTSTSSQSSDSSSSSSSSSTSTSTSTTSSSSRLGASTSDISVEEVEEEYLDKGASVITIDSDNLDRYSKGRVIIQGGRTYGIFSLTEDDLAHTPTYDYTTTRTTSTTTESASGDSVTSTTTSTRAAFNSVSELFEAVDEDDIDPDVLEKIDSILDHFDDAGVDTVIALTPSTVPFCAVDGVDVVVTFKEHNCFSVSETIDGTLYFDAPEKNQVGVLVVAPGNVVSTKVMSGD